MAYLDTHEAIKILIKEKLFNDKQAEAIVNIVNKRDGTLATKADIDLVKKDVEHIKEQMATKSDISNLSNGLELIKKDFLWIKALLVGVMGLLVKIAFF